MRVGWIVLLAVASGCGGATTSNGAGGSKSRSSGVGGTGGGAQGCTKTAPQCVFCGTDVGGDSAVCSGGAWTCPNGSVPLDQCPPGTCADGPSVEVCCDAQGNEQPPTCPDHYTETCPSGESLVSRFDCQQPPGCEATGCAADEYCHFRDASCGLGTHGQCVTRPTGCTFEDAPVCGCDGKIYPNTCAAESAGVDLGSVCQVPPGFQLCGTRLCRLGTEYCLVTVSSGGDLFACPPVPASCGGTPTCACLASGTCECSTGTDPGFVKLTCPS